MELCRRCGMRADADPQFHAERYGHWPVTQVHVDRGCRPHRDEPGYCLTHLAYCYLPDLLPEGE